MAQCISFSKAVSSPRGGGREGATRPYAPTPDAYRAGKEVELLPGFETATATDELLVEIQAGSGVLSNDYPGGQGSNDMYGAYRYGFNGQEKSDEIKGAGNSYTAEYWEYDPRIGRRWNVDPDGVPSESTYAVFRNNPVFITDSKGNCPDGSCGDKEVVAAYEIVKKNFNPKKNLSNISEQLNIDATNWFAEQYASGAYKENAKVSDFATFLNLVQETWTNAVASSFFSRYEENDRLIQSMSTLSGKAFAINSLTSEDRANYEFFNKVLMPSLYEFIGVAAGGTNPKFTVPKSNMIRTFEIGVAKNLFSGIPSGAGALLGRRGEDITELWLRRAYPNATIAKQVQYNFSKTTYMKADFVVVENNQIIAVVESKVNGSTLTDLQKLLFINSRAGTFTGANARQAGIVGKAVGKSTLKIEAKYTSESGRTVITKY